MTPPTDKAREAFEGWFATEYPTAKNDLGAEALTAYKAELFAPWQAALGSAQIKLPERKAEPTTQTADNVDEWRFVRTWNRVIDEVKALNGIE